MPKQEWNLTGQRFGRLTVTSFAEYRYQPCGRKNAYWNCLCDCGNTKVIKGGQLLRGGTKSCGCLAHDIRYKGGKSKLYDVLRMMKKRCNDKSCKQYADYGGRGIKVCDKWSNGLDGYRNFRSWAEKNGYKEGLTIDRIDNDKGYSPQNCRWVTVKDQCRNKRNNIRITLDGKTQTFTEWCEEYGVPFDLAYNRYHALGWEPIDAFTKPVEIHRRLKNG